MFDPTRLIDAFESDATQAIWDTRLGRRGGGNPSGGRRKKKSETPEAPAENTLIAQRDRLQLQDDAPPENPFESLLKRR